MRRTPAAQADTAARRLARLSEELAAARDGATGDAQAWPGTDEPVGGGPRVGEVAASPLPVPGRHAARRSSGAAAALLPETLRGRVALGPGAVAVLAVLVAAGLGVTAWLVLRADATEVTAAPLRPVTEAVPATPATPVVAAPEASAAGLGSPGTGAAASSSAELVVDVAGKVRRPGIVVLPAGSRVVDALEAAGGARRGVRLTALNLARPLVDGEQVLVGAAPAAGVAASAPPPGADGSAPAMVSLNSADRAALEELPEVGPVTAQAILDWRAAHGGFRAVDELLEVDGIGEATLARIAPHVTL
jgi:competence protein ComEA